MLYITLSANHTHTHTHTMASNCSTTHDLSESTSPTLFTPLLTTDAKNNIFGTYTFYDFNKILAGACTGVACLVVLFHLFNHATHLSVPREQMKIMRIACLIPLYAVFGLIGIIFPEADAYLDPWSDIFEANSLVAFFLLLCEYVSQHHEQRAAYFSGIELSDKKATKNGVDGATWFRVRLPRGYRRVKANDVATLVHDLPAARVCAPRRHCHRCDARHWHLLPVRD